MEPTTSSEAGALAPVRSRFRALVEAYVPRAEELDAEGWRRLLEIVEDALADRPPAVRRQLVLFVRLLGWLPLLRYGRRLESLPVERRRAFLESLQDAPVLRVRQGVWGLRTLAFMGYYGRPRAHREIGYRAHPHGWDARDAPAPWGEEPG